MEQINAADAERLCVRGSEVLRLAEGVGPRNRGVDEYVVSKIRLAFVEGSLSLLRRDFSAEDGYVVCQREFLESFFFLCRVNARLGG